ncbi:hypothetical protein ACF3VQ_21510 (plasmid) [Yersinia sp. HM-2024]|uniref:hypothetical protein n=1 Tax=Yersinia sp. HM-2024 TaxID=3344550 RepID=UPI00370D27C5
MKNTIKAVIITTVFLSSFSASAATITNATTATADVIFNKPLTPLTFNIKPTLGLVSGSHSSMLVLATFDAKSADHNSKVAVRWGDGVNGIYQGNNEIAYLVGKKNGQAIMAKLYANNSTQEDIHDSKHWYVSSKLGEIEGTIKLSGTTNIQADTYPITMVAAIFTA